MENQIKKIVLENSELLFGVNIDASIIQFQKTRKEVEGDLTLVIFPFVKVLRCSPDEAGKKIGDFLQERLSFISHYSVVSGFLNFVISNDYWLSQLEMMNEKSDFGFEKPNPYAAIRNQPSFSLTNLVAAVCTPSLSITEIEAFSGALLNPYRQRATSDRITKS